MSTSKNLVLPKSESWKMFNRISAKYDLLNRLLSFGLDIRWRKALIRCIPAEKRIFLLDLATGTGDVILTLMKNCSQIVQAKGIDLAENMLKVGREKIAKSTQAQAIQLLAGDANQIPFDNNTFDLTTIAFGIRNVEDPVQVMREMHRVLKPGGRSLILEFSLPTNPVLRFFHLTYLKIIVPFLGGLVSGDWKAYRYLNQTIEQFPYGQAFCDLLNQSGFKNVRQIPLLLGVASIYQADKGGNA